MMNRAGIKKEITELAEKIKLLASDGVDLDALQTSVNALNEKIILLKYLELSLEEKTHDSVPSPPSDMFPDIQEEVKKDAASDLFGNEISVHEKISKAKKDKPLVDKLQKKKIEDIKTAIGINEKFRFINEMFDGNDNEYNVVLNQINNFTSHAEAENYLANLKGVYKWSDENEMVIVFRELVSRKFM